MISSEMNMSRSLVIGAHSNVSSPQCSVILSCEVEVNIMSIIYIIGRKQLSESKPTHASIIYFKV